MCGTSASADRLLVVHEARVAADELVERFLRLPVAKAMNLGTRAGFEATTTIRRKDFGLSFDVPVEGGGALVSDKIDINLDVQLVKA